MTRVDSLHRSSCSLLQYGRNHGSRIVEFLSSMLITLTLIIWSLVPGVSCSHLLHATRLQENTISVPPTWLIPAGQMTRHRDTTNSCTFELNLLSISSSFYHCMGFVYKGNFDQQTKDDKRHNQTDPKSGTDRPESQTASPSRTIVPCTVTPVGRKK